MPRLVIEFEAVKAMRGNSESSTTAGSSVSGEGGGVRVPIGVEFGGWTSGCQENLNSWSGSMGQDG